MCGKSCIGSTADRIEVLTVVLNVYIYMYTCIIFVVDIVSRLAIINSVKMANDLGMFWTLPRNGEWRLDIDDN